MAKAKSILKWTAKTPLSSRIIDPLGLYVLKHLERYFLNGITTQTERLRYFTLLTWAWKIVDEQKLSNSKVLDIEKVATLAAAFHHLNDSYPPGGIRNRISAIDFLKSHGSVKIHDYTNFGRENKVGYGNYYYRGPLATLHICGKYAGKTLFSEIGEDVVEIFSRRIGKRADFLLKDAISKRELADLSEICFCSNKIPPDEQEIWRAVFFGFTKPSSGVGLRYDKEEYAKFERNEMAFQEIKLDKPMNIEEYLKDIESLEIIISDDLSEMVKTAIARRQTLFLILKIIQESKPQLNDEPLDQIIRDCLYFHQFGKDEVSEINFGKMDDFSKSWESYVHNLYYINFFELMFGIFLNELMIRPLGTTINEIVSSFNIAEITNHLKVMGAKVSGQIALLTEVDSFIKDSLKGKKSSLDTTPNEKQAALNALVLEFKEERVANLLLLFLLLRYRFESFSEEQRNICDFGEYRLFSITPKSAYSNLTKGNVSDFLYNILTLLKNRHGLISSMKFRLNDTRSWLFTEEDGLLCHFGRDYDVAFYREAKWGNVIELLIDMGLISLQGMKYCLTKVGKQWLMKAA